MKAFISGFHPAVRLRATILGVLLAAAGAATAQAQTLVDGRVAHVIVALADNRYQGIVPVPAAIGDGDDPGRNLYWGAGYGLRTFLRKSATWEAVGGCTARIDPVIERCVFRHRREKVYVVADAYRGREIRRAVSDFFAFAAGRAAEKAAAGNGLFVRAGGASDLVAYVGHDGLMDFPLERYEMPADRKQRDAVVLACASKYYFAEGLRRTGARPLLWTTGLMAPEAYVIEAVLAGWAQNETADQIRTRAAQAYDKYQRCGVRGAMRLFATGW